jgi:hypothetical protein
MLITMRHERPAWLQAYDEVVAANQTLVRDLRLGLVLHLLASLVMPVEPLDHGRVHEIMLSEGTLAAVAR